jgi:hypothetical protein
MRKIIRIPCCVLSLVLAASPCVADPFCDGLAKVAEAAPNQFRGMWSEADPPAPTWAVESSYTIPGAAALHYHDGSSSYACSVAMTFEPRDPNDNQTGADSENSAILPGHYFYECQFPAPAGAVAASEAMVARLAGCVATQAPSPAGNYADFRTYTIVRNGIKYLVDALDTPANEHDLNVKIMQEFVPAQ